MCPAPQGSLPLRRGAPTLEPVVWELNLAPAWGPGLRNGAPGAGPGFPLSPWVRRAAGTGWGVWRESSQGNVRLGATAQKGGEHSL